jgi:hypothetical protein
MCVVILNDRMIHPLIIMTMHMISTIRTTTEFALYVESFETNNSGTHHITHRQTNEGRFS